MIPGKSPKKCTSDRNRHFTTIYAPASNNPSKNLVTATAAKECTPAIPIVMAPQENINIAIHDEGGIFLSR
jgi:hypothetical protein